MYLQCIMATSGNKGVFVITIHVLMESVSFTVHEGVVTVRKGGVSVHQSLAIHKGVPINLQRLCICCSCWSFGDDFSGFDVV